MFGPRTPVFLAEFSLTKNDPAQNPYRKWGVPPCPPKRNEYTLEVVFDAVRKLFL